MGVINALLFLSVILVLGLMVIEYCDRKQVVVVITKEEMEKLLNNYGVAFTSVLADRLLEVIAEEREKAVRGE